MFLSKFKAKKNNQNINIPFSQIHPVFTGVTQLAEIRKINKISTQKQIILIKQLKISHIFRVKHLPPGVFASKAPNFF